MATVTETLNLGRPAPTSPAPSAAAAFRPAAAGWVARGVVWGAAAFLVLVFPLMRPGPEVNLYSLAAIYAIIGLSLNVLLGYTGQISLGHHAFVGVGAFTSAYLVSRSGQSFAVAVAVAAAVGAAQALVLGAVSLRVRGLYFALVTLVYGSLAETNLFNIRSLTGGGAGQRAPRPSMFASHWRYYYLCLALLAVVLFVDWRMMRTKGGRALLALRENPRVAATFGVNVKAFTLFAFVVAGIFAGLGGALYGHRNTRVVNVVFEFRLSLIFVIMTVVGGLRSRVGVVIGSAFFALLDFFLVKLPGHEAFLSHTYASVPWIVLIVALPLMVAGIRGHDTRETAIGGVLAALAGLTLLALLFDLPGIASTLRSAPGLTPEVARLVIGPLLLLVTLVQFPGGIAQQFRPVFRWLGGRRFDPHDRGEKEVQVSDVRA